MNRLFRELLKRVAALEEAVYGGAIKVTRNEYRHMAKRPDNRKPVIEGASERVDTDAVSKVVIPESQPESEQPEFYIQLQEKDEQRENLVPDCQGADNADGADSEPEVGITVADMDGDGLGFDTAGPDNPENDDSEGREKFGYLKSPFEKPMALGDIDR